MSKAWTWFWKQKTRMYPNEDGGELGIARWSTEHKKEKTGTLALVVDTRLGVIRLEHSNFAKNCAVAIDIPFDLVPDFCNEFSRAMNCLLQDEEERTEEATKYITW